MAIINKPNVILHGEPDLKSENADEMLYGMPCEILEEQGELLKIKAFYDYTGYVHKSAVLDNKASSEFDKKAKHLVLRNWIDVLAEPKVQARMLQEIPRGGRICLLEDLEDGWSKVLLADGEEGFTKTGFLRAMDDHPDPKDEEAFRKAVVETAKLYLGTQYRWAGESPIGIDCSGLTHMSYLINGVIIYRDAKIKEGFPVKEIAFEDKQPGDLMFYPGHVVMYIGDNLYIHSTAYKGSDGVVINSLNPDSPLYRADLEGKLLMTGSIY